MLIFLFMKVKAITDIVSHMRCHLFYGIYPLGWVSVIQNTIQISYLSSGEKSKDDNSPQHLLVCKYCMVQFFMQNYC